MRLKIDTARGEKSIRVDFTEQRLTAHAGLVTWASFLEQREVRAELARVLPHSPSSPNAYDPCDIALGFMGGILTDKDKLSRIAWLRSDPALPEVLGIEAMPSQATFSRFFMECSQRSCDALGTLHNWAVRALPSAREKEGYTLDLDSTALLHEDGRQEGVRVGYTPKGLKPCHRPLLAALAEEKIVANYWLRRGDSACSNNAAAFLEETVRRLPKHIRVGLLRADSGFDTKSVLTLCETLKIRYVLARALRQNLKALCRHEDAAWTATEVAGLEVQEVAGERLGQRIIILRQRIAERPQAGGKKLLDVPGYRFAALVTNLPSSYNALWVWRRYNGRADIENRIKEIGHQFALKSLCGQKFWATEAMGHLAIFAYNLCVLFMRRLGMMEQKIELRTLRWRLFSCAGVFSLKGGKPTLKMAIEGESARAWWLQVLKKLTALPNCNAFAWPVT